MDFNQVGVETLGFQHSSCTSPFAWLFGCSLVLYEDLISGLKGRELLGAMPELFFLDNVTLGKGFFSKF